MKTLSDFLCGATDITPDGCKESQPCLCVLIGNEARVKADLLAALNGLAALDRTPDRYASPEVLAARAAIAKAERS